VQVDARTRVPREFVKDGQIVLNVSPDATHQLLMGNDEITFQTRFNGASFPVLVPVDAVIAVYARENGQGMAFEANAAAHETPGDSPSEAAGTDETANVEPLKPEPPAKRGGHLTRIK
jgi:stringent starvation protein B